jgi:hypothetical protein
LHDLHASAHDMMFDLLDASSGSSVVSNCATVMLQRPQAPVNWHHKGSDGALALPTDRFASSFDLPAHYILQDLHALLFPDAQSIRAQLRKLSVYRPGGKAFKAFEVGVAIVCSCCFQHAGCKPMQCI